MSEFLRFPKTPHLAWLGPGRPRDDKELPVAEMQALLSHAVLVEEKVDGANLGFSVGVDERLQVQNRGNFLDEASLHPQFKPLRHWLAVHRDALVKALGHDLILFGEWCYATHSVHYTRLPDWFIAFDVYDRPAGKFWSAERRNRLAHMLELAVVPALAKGRFTLEEVKRFLAVSRFADAEAEGVYVRWDTNDHLEQRAKLVRGEFTQAMDEHWSRGPLRLNRLAKHAPSTAAAPLPPDRRL